MSKHRIDRSTLRPATRLEDGRLRAEAHITRTGVFDYMMPDGSIRRELRDATDVFAPESLSSFEMVPVTNDHPPAGIDVNAWNARQLMIGTLGEKVTRDDDHVRAALMVADAETIAQMEAGKVEVSCGYMCDTVEEPGVHPVFGAYDARQINIRGNHVAIVDRGRAGPTARVRMDGASVQLDQPRVMTVAHARPSGDSAMANPKRGISMADDKETKIMVEEAAKQLDVARRRADTAESQLSAATARADRAEGEAESLRAEVKRLKENRVDEEEVRKRDERIGLLTRELEREKKARADAEDPKRLQDAVKLRTRINSFASIVLGSKKVADSASDRELMIACIERVHGKNVEKRDDGTVSTDDYVQARFDAAMEGYVSGEKALDELRDLTHDEREDARHDARPSVDPRKEYVARQQNAWKQNASGKGA